MLDYFSGTVVNNCTNSAVVLSQCMFLSDQNKRMPCITRSKFKGSVFVGWHACTCVHVGACMSMFIFASVCMYKSDHASPTFALDYNIY